MKNENILKVANVSFMNIVFFIAFEKSPYSGAIRPFINWGKTLSKKNKIEFVLFQCSDSVVKHLSDQKLSLKEFNELEKAKTYLTNCHPDYIVGDDSYERLKILIELAENCSAKTVVYAQILFGLHAISRLNIVKPTSITTKLIFPFKSFIPFVPLTVSYRNLLKKVSYVIANSQSTANLLYFLYGINIRNIIYPPLDKNIFKSIKVKKENAVLLYTGSYRGDTDEKLIAEISCFLKEKKIKVYLLGNKEVQQKVKNIYSSAISLNNISDSDLAGIYNKCIITITPQEFELCGYVPLESMFCGTPVLAYGYLGPSETIIDEKTGFLCYNQTDFINKLQTILGEKIFSVDMKDSCRNRVEELLFFQNSDKQFDFLK